jgi:predicted nucleic acid-binding protein
MSYGDAGLILLDTTVLVYAVGGDHPLQAPCRAAIQLLGDGRVRATTTVQVIQEFAYIRARRRSRSDAVTLALNYATVLGPLTQPELGDIEEGLLAFRASVTLGPFDAVLAATARRRGWSLASADQAFGSVEGLTHLDPASPRFLDLVRAAG